MSGFRKLSSVVLSVCLFHIFNGKVHASEKGPEFSGVVVVLEGSDAILPCSLSTKEDIEFKVFDWRKDGQKEVFLYDAGVHYNNGRDGQDLQFKGRVSHFSDQLKNGNASIKIQNTKVADSGNYTCDFPHLQPRQTFHIELAVVEFIFKDRSAEKAGAAPEPYIKILDATDDGVRLQCNIRGVSPKPEVEWKDRAGNILPAEEKVSYRGGRYSITLLTTVTKTDHLRCVVTQEEIHHQTEAETFVFINEGTIKDESPWINGPPTGWIVSAVFCTLLLVLAVGCVLFSQSIIKVNHLKGRRKHENGSEECRMSEKPPMAEHEQEMSLDRSSTY